MTHRMFIRQPMLDFVLQLTSFYSFKIMCNGNSKVLQHNRNSYNSSILGTNRYATKILQRSSNQANMNINMTVVVALDDFPTANHIYDAFVKTLSQCLFENSGFLATPNNKKVSFLKKKKNLQWKLFPEAINHLFVFVRGDG